VPSFSDVVKKAWDEPTSHVDLYNILHHKLSLTGKILNIWSRSLFPNTNTQLHMALKVILLLPMLWKEGLIHSGPYLTMGSPARSARPGPARPKISGHGPARACPWPGPGPEI
jgi:hypothetical protein